MGAMGSLDLWIFHAINGWSGFWVLDWIAGFADRSELLKAGVLVAAFWWFWFSPASRPDVRRIIISALLGTIVALFVARGLASALPFRVRPIFATGIGYLPPTLPMTGYSSMEDWSSFPSDHGAMWFALVYGACPDRLALPPLCTASFGSALVPESLLYTEPPGLFNALFFGGVGRVSPKCHTPMRTAL